MSWDRANVAAALVGALAGTGVKVHPRPPATFNPPAYIVGYPITVDYGLPTFGVDQASLAVMCAAGIDQTDTVDQLIADAVAALNADTTLAGVVQVLQVRQQRNWRPQNVGGADYLIADLNIDIRM